MPLVLLSFGLSRQRSAVRTYVWSRESVSGWINARDHSVQTARPQIIDVCVHGCDVHEEDHQSNIVVVACHSQTFFETFDLSISDVRL